MARRLKKIKKIFPSIYLEDIIKRENLIQKRGDIFFSNNKVITFKEDLNQDKIYLVSQFFIHSDQIRRKEIIYCLKKNIELMGEIILLNDRLYTAEEMELSNSEFQKVNQISVGERLTYKIFLDYFFNSDKHFSLANLGILALAIAFERFVNSSLPSSISPSSF